LLYRFEDANGALIKKPSSLSILGPKGWNNNKMATGLKQEAITWAAQVIDTPPISGNYGIEALIDNQVLFSKSFLSPVTPMDRTAIRVTSKSASEVSASWNAVSKAVSYIVQVFDTNANSLSLGQTRVKTTTANLTGLSLTTNKNYFIWVYACNWDATTENPAFPEQVLASISLSTQFTLP
jgi:hypothetical protein